MRHGKKINHLSRTSSHRRAMLANMACSLIERKRINTTLAKAKALRQYVEPLITKSKDDSTNSRRVVFSYLQSKDAVSELFRDVAPKVAERNGGYTRILKTGNRLGDNAEMCFIELVDFNETYILDRKEKKTTTRRSRRGGKTSEATAPKAETKASSPKVKAEDKSADVTDSIEVIETAEEVTTEEVKVETKSKEVKAEAETDAENSTNEEKESDSANPEEEKKD